MTSSYSGPIQPKNDYHNISFLAAFWCANVCARAALVPEPWDQHNFQKEIEGPDDSADHSTDTFANAVEWATRRLACLEG